MTLKYKTCDMTRHLVTTNEIIAWRLKVVSQR